MSLARLDANECTRAVEHMGVQANEWEEGFRASKLLAARIAYPALKFCEQS